MTANAILVEKYIPEKLKNKSIEDLEIILNKYNDQKELEIKKKELIINKINAQNNEDEKRLAIDKLKQMNIKDNANINYKYIKLFANIFTGFISKSLNGFKDIITTRGVLVQYLIMIFIVVMFIIWFFGGFSNSKNVIKNTKANNPSDIMNANNIYKQNNNGFLSKLIPKSMFYYLGDFNNSFNKIFYNKDIILSNSSDRPNQNNNGRHDDMLAGDYPDDCGKIMNYLKPNDIEWELPENSYINSDFNKLPDYIKDYNDNGSIISLNNKKIIVFPYKKDSNGIYLLENPVYKYNYTTDNSLPIGNLQYNITLKDNFSIKDNYRYEIKINPNN